MKKKLLIIASLVLLAGCSTSVPTQSEPAKISDEAAFQRKLECSKFIKAAETKTEQYGKEIAGDKGMSWPNMEKVFYSSKTNSCLFVWSNNMMLIEGNKKTSRTDRGVNDVLSGEELVREIYIEGDASLGNEPAMLERFVSQLKQYDQ